MTEGGCHGLGPKVLNFALFLAQGSQVRIFTGLGSVHGFGLYFIPCVSLYSCLSYASMSLCLSFVLLSVSAMIRCLVISCFIFGNLCFLLPFHGLMFYD